MSKHIKKGAGGSRANSGRKAKDPKKHAIRITDEELKLIQEKRANESGEQNKLTWIESR